MPNVKSAKKSLRTSQQAYQQNVAVRTGVKSARRKFMEAAESKDTTASTDAYKAYCSVLDNAAKHGVIKKNTASRRKGRAANKLRAIA